MSYLPFAGLFFCSTLARAMLLSVLPLQALALLGDAQSVSALYFTVSAGGVLASLCAPVVIRLLGNYRTFLASLALMAVSALLLMDGGTGRFMAGFLVHLFAIALTEVTLGMYVMQRVSRRELSSFEPLRVLCLVSSLSVGPWLGVYLESRVAHWLPYALAVLAALVTLVYFHALRLHRVEVPPVSPAASNPWRNMGRFFAQPRLRLAWGLALARSSWWMMFIVYSPIYAQQSGLGELVGAGVVSIGSAWTLSVPFWGWCARRYGTRRLLAWGFAITAALSLAAFGFAARPWLVIGLLLAAALGATMLDGVGNVLFMRAVRPLERAAMSGVFMTYRDVANLAPPGLFALLLSVTALPVVFAGAALWMGVAACYARFVPRRM